MPRDKPCQVAAAHQYIHQRIPQIRCRGISLPQRIRQHPRTGENHEGHSEILLLDGLNHIRQIRHILHHTTGDERTENRNRAEGCQRVLVHLFGKAKVGIRPAGGIPAEGGGMEALLLRPRALGKGHTAHGRKLVGRKVGICRRLPRKPHGGRNSEIFAQLCREEKLLYEHLWKGT